MDFGRAGVLISPHPGATKERGCFQALRVPRGACLLSSELQNTPKRGARRPGALSSPARGSCSHFVPVSAPLPCPVPRIPLTPAADCIPAALSVGWALLFSLQMRSDICTRLSQRVSKARGHRPIDRARRRGRQARRHPKLP